MSTTVERTTHSQVLDVAGTSLHIDVKGEGAPLVVLHRSTGPLWTPFHDALAQRFHVRAVHMPGFGQSQRPDDARSTRDLAIHVHLLLDALDADRVHLVGLGLGGWVAAEMATMNQNRLVTLTLVGAAGVKPRAGEIHDPMLAGFIDYVRLGFRDPRDFDTMFGAEPAPEMVELWDYSREMTARVTWKPWMWSGQLPSLLRGVRTPTAVVHGGNDRIIPLDCAEQYAELLSAARLRVVADAGHLVELERPVEVAALISDLAAVAH
jgi:pimeloyl-ACP methyl ester carboxylesterase